MRRRTAFGSFVLAGLLAACAAGAFAQGDAKRGEYLATAGGCVGCHTENVKGAAPYAGGRELKTPFGTFYGPNITPDPQAGIGRWSEADFVHAMREGLRPDGANYFPAFPYPSFTRIVDEDLRDLWAHLRTLAPSSRPSRPHDLRFPFSSRSLVASWKQLFFRPGPFVADGERPALVNRGAYIAEALSHCGECHTPRNLLGGPKRSHYLAGGKGPEGKDVANITPAALKKWNDKELREFLETGITPEGDVTAETMGEVVSKTTARLKPEDLTALIAYLRSIPAIADDPK